MKLLYVSIQGLDLYPEGLEIDFIARQRVTDSNNVSLSHLFGTIYKQDVLGIIGINASGKTTTLRWISFLLDVYLNEGKVNDKEYKSLLLDQQITTQATFMDKSGLYKIETVIKKDANDEHTITEEIMWEKNIVKSLNRKTILNFTDKQITTKRSELNDNFLSDHMSIMISKMKKEDIRPRIIDQLRDTNVNIMRVSGIVPEEIIQYLDSSIEYVVDKKNNKEKFHLQLKFKDQAEVIDIYNPFDLPLYLSSGTIKGLNIFAGVSAVLATGGFLIVDEIENHFNESVVKTIIQMFQNKKINVTGATLVFTTHYAALLDEFERNDSIYISLKEEKLRLSNLSDLLNRHDYKKSEIYQSSYVGKTAPSYDDYLALKKYYLHKAAKLKDMPEVDQ